MSQDIQVSAEMPRYKSHKEVHALKIVRIGSRSVVDGARLYFEHPFAPIEVDQKWVDQHEPKAGGYYVVYDDGYTSWSPAEAFEQGYTRIGG